LFVLCSVLIGFLVDTRMICTKTKVAASAAKKTAIILIPLLLIKPDKRYWARTRLPIKNNKGSPKASMTNPHIGGPFVRPNC
jgi:hypothetical protein